MFKPVFYFTVSGICITFSLALMIAETLMKVTRVFSRVGLYLFVSSLVSLTYAFFNVPGLEQYSREILIIQRITSLAGGFALTRLINASDKPFIKKPVVIAIFAALGSLILIAFADLIGDFGWLFLDSPERTERGSLYPILYAPFSFIVFPAAVATLVVATRRFRGEEKKLANLLVGGVIAIALAGLWDHAGLAAKDGPAPDRVYLFNPAILVLALLVFAFIVQFIRLRLKYGRRVEKEPTAAARGEPSTARLDADDAAYERILDAASAKRGFADPDVSITEIAAAAGVSRNAASRIINERSGGNFSAFINAYRVAEMKRRLSDPRENATVMDIARESGFNSKASMNRVFKELAGSTPAEFRASRSSGREGTAEE